MGRVGEEEEIKVGRGVFNVNRKQFFLFPIYWGPGDSEVNQVWL